MTWYLKESGVYSGSRVVKSMTIQQGDSIRESVCTVHVQSINQQTPSRLNNVQNPPGKKKEYTGREKE